RGRRRSLATRSGTRRSQGRSCSGCGGGSCAASRLVPVEALAEIEHYGGEHDDQHEEHERDRRAVADVVVNEGNAVEIEVDRLRGGAGPPLSDREDDV